MDNLKFLGRLVTVHSVFILAFTIVAAPQESIDSLVYIMWFGRYVVALLTIVLVCIKYRDKYNLFLLPLSFIPLPFAFYVLLTLARTVFDMKYADPGGWEILSIADAFVFSLPFFVITLIFSIVFEAKKKKHNGTEQEEQPRQSRS